MSKEKDTETAVATQQSSQISVPATKLGGVKKLEGYDSLKEEGLVDSTTDYEAAMKEIDEAIQDNTGVGEIQISRISIAQPGTPEVASAQAGWQAGMLFDSQSREVITEFGKPPWLLARGVESGDIKAVHYLPIVFIFKLPSEYVMWPSKEEREQGIKNFHWKDLDPASPRVREGMWPPKGIWRGEGAPPVTEHLNLLGIGLNTDCSPKTNLIIASFSRTSFRTGQKLVTNLSQHKMSSLPYWGRVYYLFTQSHTEDRQTWYTIEFAKGPRLDKYGLEAGGSDEINRLVNAQCFKNARDLSNKDSGRTLQELMINAAAFADEESYTSSANSGSENSEEDGDPAF